MSFPSVITTFNYPQSTDKLNSPSHSALENLQSSTIGQIENIIGLSGNSSTLGTLIGDLRSPASGGGGHVQTAPFGGTGVTTYVKGDILVATSSSVIARQGIGTDGQVFVSDSTQTNGVNWGSPTKIGTVASIISIRGVSETSILSSTIPASIMGSSNVMEATMFIDNFAASGSVLVKANYGGAVVSSVMILPTGTLTSIYGRINYTLLANGTNLQRGILELDLGRQADPSAFGSVLSIRLYDMNVSSVATATNKTMGVTVKMSNASANDHIDIDSSITKKIV